MSEEAAPAASAGRNEHDDLRPMLMAVTLPAPAGQAERAEFEAGLVILAALVERLAENGQRG